MHTNTHPSPISIEKKPWDWNKICAEPYRLLFPLGTASAAIGMGIWIPYYFWPQAFSYPGQGHAVIQIQAFLLCFIFGFLTTMLPKILGVKPLDPISYLAFPVLLISIIAASLANAPFLAQIFHLLILINFLGFIARRFPRRKSNPPPAFLFIAVAMLVDTLGIMAKLTALSGYLADSLTGPTLRSSSILQYQAFPLLLILGVGGFLLPKLFANGPVDPQALRLNSARRLTTPITLCALFLTSYVIEIFGIFNGNGNISLQLAYTLRAAVWTWFLFVEIRIHKVPGKLQPYLGAVRMALYVMAAALFMPIFLPQYMLAWEHMIFISGFMHLTLSIASRVLTAHAGRLDILSMHGRKIRVYGSLLFLSMLTRIATEIWTGGHYLHLALAAAFALSALFMWGRIYVPLVKIHPGR